MTTWVGWHQKGKPIWILLEQERWWGGSSISWTICKSFAPRSRQKTMPVPHHSVFAGRMPFLPANQQRQSTEGRRQSTESTTRQHSKFSSEWSAWHTGGYGRRRDCQRQCLCECDLRRSTCDGCRCGTSLSCQHAGCRDGRRCWCCDWQRCDDMLDVRSSCHTLSIWLDVWLWRHLLDNYLLLFENHRRRSSLQLCHWLQSCTVHTA